MTKEQQQPFLVQVPEYLNAGARQFGFMLRGLKELAPRAAGLNIPFFLFRGDPTQTVPAFVRDAGAALLVTDYAALRLGRQWRKEVRHLRGFVAMILRGFLGRQWRK